MRLIERTARITCRSVSLRTHIASCREKSSIRNIKKTGSRSGQEAKIRCVGEATLLIRKFVSSRRRSAAIATRSSLRAMMRLSSCRSRTRRLGRRKATSSRQGTIDSKRSRFRTSSAGLAITWVRVAASKVRVENAFSPSMLMKRLRKRRACKSLSRSLSCKGPTVTTVTSACDSHPSRLEPSLIRSSRKSNRTTGSAPGSRWLISHMYRPTRGPSRSTSRVARILSSAAHSSK